MIETLSVFKTETRNNQFFISTGNLDGEDNAEAVESNAEYWHPCGVIALPSDVHEDLGAAECLSVPSRDQSKVIAFRDFRAEEIVGSLLPGETCIYALGSACDGQGRIFLKDGGIIALYSTVGNEPDGESMMFAIDPEKGIRSMLDKSYFSISTDNEISFANDMGGLKLDSQGNISINAKQLTLAAESMVFGGSANATQSVCIAEKMEAIVSKMLGLFGSLTAPPTGGTVVPDPVTVTEITNLLLAGTGSSSAKVGA